MPTEPLPLPEGDFKELAGRALADPRCTLPFGGPVTAPHMVDKAATSAVGGFVNRHDRWVAFSGVSKNSPIVHEHETLSRALQFGLVWDRLNLKRCAMAEFLCRRMQLQEDVVAECPTNPTFDGAHHYMGIDDRAGGATMAPSPRAHVSTELAKDASIAKEKRKAREAKGRGKGKKQEEP